MKKTNSASIERTNLEGKTNPEQINQLINQSKNEQTLGLLKTAYYALLPVAVYGTAGFLAHMTSSSDLSNLENLAFASLGFSTGILAGDLISRGGLLENYMQRINESRQEIKQAKIKKRFYENIKKAYAK